MCSSFPFLDIEKAGYLFRFPACCAAGGALNNDVSAEIESFHDNLLEYPQYTRPEVYQGMRVPEVLLSGHHKNIETWRRQQSIRRTLERRPDLLEEANLSKKERQYLAELMAEKEAQET